MTSGAGEFVRSKRGIMFDLFHTLTTVESSWADGRPSTCEMLGVSMDRERSSMTRKGRRIRGTGVSHGFSEWSRWPGILRYG